jgi:hypothetical protein
MMDDRRQKIDKSPAATVSRERKKLFKLIDKKKKLDR